MTIRQATNPTRIRITMMTSFAFLFFALTTDAAQKNAAGSKIGPPELSDQVVMLAVENELLRSEAVDGHRINVKVADGIVTLSGRVSHLLARKVAVGLAKRVRGVLSVIDEMEINFGRSDDSALKKDLTKALAHDPTTRNLKLDVVASDGTVTIKGEAPSIGEKTLVSEVAMGVKGVVELKNQVAVVQKVKQTDVELRDEIRKLFRFSVRLDNTEIEVSVKKGQVVLNGKVTSSFQKSYAEELAMRAGAEDVDNRGLKVIWQERNALLRTQRYENATDAKILEALQRSLKYDPRVLSFSPHVQVKMGVVTLTGDVGHLTAKRSAEEDALNTIGVRQVKNNLRVRWSDQPLSDEQIADFARQALKRDPYVERHNLIIECRNAHVSVYGLVDMQFEKYHAEWIVSCQKGVVHVNDYLAVKKKWLPKSDATIQADLKEKLLFTFVEPNNQVTATVEDGVAILRGTVDTWYMWQTAMDQAIAAGARRPHNLIEVRYGLPSGPHYYGPHTYVPR